MNKTIVIIGAGSGIGKAIAERFGKEGFQVALISRNADKLLPIVKSLSEKGIKIEAFTADVLHHTSLKSALENVKSRFGGIDVLEYSPAVYDDIQTPRNINVINLQKELNFHLLGAVAAIQEVLPELIEKRNGAILFTTAVSALYPVTFTASIGVAIGALLNYARVLHQDLKTDGIYAGIVMVAGWVVEKGQEHQDKGDGISLVFPEDVAEKHWQLFNERNTIEAIVGDPTPIQKFAGLI
ncbi:SDR family oxidoreductase [Olivibacter sp. XZL3]|uniref:SDR family NAD(P)-dependent oxidoreductase n=1 Tax=Olivibacter sp. XZL3 TaxID=1735116 RepID=UPI001065051C|nr:SDR family NAD(P)-dependent oxidoreductase [Olivibacter sp. XZL3]